MSWDQLLGGALLVAGAWLAWRGVPRLRRKDRCLRLFDGSHVTYVREEGGVSWGDLLVTAGGLELLFDAPYRDHRGVTKCSELVFNDELKDCVTLCRTSHPLREEEQQDRQHQLRRSVDGGQWWRRRRFFWLERGVAPRAQESLERPDCAAHEGEGEGAKGLSSSRSDSRRDGVPVRGRATGRDALLERHLGRLVVVELQNPRGGRRSHTEVAGFLVAYSQRYLAIFHVSEEPPVRFEVDAERPEGINGTEGVGWEVGPRHVLLRYQGEDPLILLQVAQGERIQDFSVVLLCGTSLLLRREPGESMLLRFEQARGVDLVCPRSKARVRFGCDHSVHRRGWAGAAPEMEWPRSNLWRPPGMIAPRRTDITEGPKLLHHCSQLSSPR